MKTSKSIQASFRRALFLLFITCLVISIPIITAYTRSETYAATKKQLDLLLDMRQAVREFVANDVTPVLTEQGLFHPPAVAPGLATQFVADEFAKIQPDYYVQLASDNPLNPTNTPQEFEQAMIDRFRDNRDLKEILQVGSIDRGRYLMEARPAVSKAGCLQCHGKPEDVLEVIRRDYGIESGYNYELGRVVGASVFAIPLQNVNNTIFIRSIIAIGILSAIFLAIFATLNQLVNHLVLRPVLHISQLAREVSEGSIDRKISTSRQDEIGELFRSFELMRRSLAAASRRMRSKKERKDS